MPTTEIATLVLVPGSELGDPNNPASAVVKDCGNTIMQQDGFQQQRFGMEVENPNTLQLFIGIRSLNVIHGKLEFLLIKYPDWDSKKHHEDFMAAEHYKPFAKKFQSIMSEDPHLFHVDFQPDGGLQAAMSGPVTEIATFYFDGGPPDDARESCAKFIDICEKEGNVMVSGWSYGITHEEIEREGVKGKGAVLTIGWESVQAHMDFRETKTFKDNIHLLRMTAKKIEMHHTQFMNFQPS